MQAFPEGSLNNTLGGAGPVNTRPDHSAFMGNNDVEAFKDYGAAPNHRGSSKDEMPIFDPRSRSSVVYGDDSLGLGASTFLEGTPASRTAIHRREVEHQIQSQELAMKRQKSVAHRAKRLVTGEGPRDLRSGPNTKPEGVYRRDRSRSDLQTSGSGVNPSETKSPFNDFENSNEEHFSVRKRSDASNMSQTSPKRGLGLERHAMLDGASDSNGQKAAGGGLLARVKSLKGGKRQKPEPPTEPAPPTPDLATGSAS